MAVLKRNLDYAHLVVAHTQHVSLELTRDLGIDAPIVEIPHGPLFTSERLPPRVEAAARIGHGTGPTVLFLGLIRPYKGLDLLFDAWREVRASVPNSTLLVVGKILDRAAAPDLERLRSEAGVQVIDRYVPVPEMLDYYAVADVVVFPYRRISQSGGLMTAAGLGRPTVVTPIEGLLEQVANLRSALVAEDVSGPAIARAIVLSLQKRDVLADEAEADRAAIARSPLGWTSVAGATLRAYEARIRTSGNAAPGPLG